MPDIPKYYNSQTHIFTNESSDSNIIMKAGDGELLNFYGTIHGSIGSKVYVEAIEDMPLVSSNVVLEANKTYVFMNNLDLVGYTMYLDTGVILQGATGNITLSNCLMINDSSVKIFNLTFQTSTYLMNFVAIGTKNIYVRDCTFTSVATMGIIDNFNGVLFENCTFTNSYDLRLKSILNTVVFRNCIFNIGSANEFLFLNTNPPTISSYFLAEGCVATVVASGIVFDFINTMTVPNQGIIFRDNILYGAGLFSYGYDSTSDKSLFYRNIGFSNSESMFSIIYCNGNQNVAGGGSGATLNGTNFWNATPVQTGISTSRPTYNSTTGVFTITKAGIYQICSNLATNNTAGQTIAAGVLKNKAGVVLSLGDGYLYSPNLTSRQSAITCRLAVGDTVECAVYVAGVTTINFSGAQCYLSIYLIE